MRPRAFAFTLLALWLAAGAMGIAVIGTAAQAAEGAVSYRVLC